MPSKFLGVSRAKIRIILNTDKSNHRRNANFLNKGKLTPIRARNVHVGYRTDLMDMSEKDPWRWILVIDFFSRLLWLRPLESKSSQVIAIEPKCNYKEYGSPEIIQCDQGGDFNKALKLLCDRMNIKLI